METAEQIDTIGALDADTSRDYEAEARDMGWRAPDEFPGDGKKFIDAKTFVERGETMLPLVKAELAKSKQEIAELKRQFKQASTHFSKTEERAYQRALTDLQQRHDDAVEVGDKLAAKRVVDEMRGLEKDFEQTKAIEAPSDQPTPDQLRAELNEWVEANDWYVLDDSKRRYADMQAETMGPAENWTGGRKAWFDELAKRVDTKFADRPPTQTNGSGNRSGAKGGKTFSDLPPEAKRLAEKWVKSGLIKSRDDYVRSYQWDA